MYFLTFEICFNFDAYDLIGSHSAGIFHFLSWHQDFMVIYIWLQKLGGGCMILVDDGFVLILKCICLTFEFICPKLLISRQTSTLIDIYFAGIFDFLSRPGGWRRMHDIGGWWIVRCKHKSMRRQYISPESIHSLSFSVNPKKNYRGKITKQKELQMNISVKRQYIFRFVKLMPFPSMHPSS